MFLSSKRVEFYLKSKYPFHRSHLHSDPLFVLEKKKNPVSAVLHRN